MFLLVLLIAPLSGSPAWAGSSSALVGTWSGDFGGEPFQLILNADGTGQMDGPIRWEAKGNKLVIAEDDGSTEYTFALKGSKMTVSGGDLEAPLTLIRIGGAGKAAPPGVDAGAPPAAKAPAGREASRAAGKASGSAAQRFLAGHYWAFSGHSTGSGSYSREQRAALCSDGTFFMGSETGSSGGSGTAGVTHGDSGRWTAQGNEMRGTLTLTFSDGRREQIPYETSTNPKDRSGYGPAVIFDGTNYQRTGDGHCQ
jgi:hypothetical protein